MDAHECTRYTCEGCNALFESKLPKRFCTRQCNKRHLRTVGPKLSRDVYLEVARAKAIATSKNYFYCEYCWQLSYRKLSGAHMSSGTGNRFCSMQCLSNSCEVIRIELAFLRSLAIRHKQSTLGRFRGIRDIARSIANIARKRARDNSKCKTCGGAIKGMRDLGCPKKYCSDACYRQSEKFIVSRRVSRLSRKRRIKSIGAAEKIDPYKVFDAAGWRCQICNKPTPKKLRGTYHKRAPELDHIVPVSKGGSHTWANVQCACRECNAWKSDRVVVGQIGLFTGLI